MTRHDPRALALALALSTVGAACASTDRARSVAPTSPTSRVAPDAVATTDAPVDVAAPQATPPAPVGLAAGAASAAEAPSPFRDAVIGRLDREDAVLQNRLSLCPIPGRTFVCGVSDLPLVATDTGVAVDAEAAAAAARAPIAGYAISTTGTWPGDAWLITRAAASIATHAYRRSGGAWVDAGSWGGHGWHPVAAPWGNGLLTSNVEANSGKEDDLPYALRLVDRHGTHPPPASTLLGKDARVQGPQEPNVQDLASAGGVTFLAAVSGAGLSIETRARHGSGAPRVYRVIDAIPADAWVVARLWASSVDSAAVFGRVRRQTGGDAFLFTFDGSTWARAELPAGVDGVDSYDRGTTDGRPVERIVGTTGTGLAFFERDLPIGAARVGAWRPIPLPHVHPGDRLTEGWVANDDAWLLVWPEDLTKEPPRLMRTRPVQRVWVYATETPKE